MAKKYKVVLNKAGVREMLRSEEAAAICRELAEAIQGRVGDGFTVNTYTGTNRVNASVWAETDEAMQKCLDDNALLKAVHK